MAEFYAGEQKTAIVPVTNPTEKGFDYRMELYMGTNLAIMAEVSFHLNAGEQKDVSLPVTMPAAIGVYPVHLGLYSGDTVFGPYQAEDVVITTTPVSIASFKYSYIYAGYYRWARLSGIMVYPEKVDYIGFSVLNLKGEDIGGVTVAFKVTPIGGATSDISSPVYQFPPPGNPVVMTPPFTLLAGGGFGSEFYFRFDPAGNMYNPVDYVAVAEVYVDGVLVASRLLNFYPDWGEPTDGGFPK